MQQKIYNGMKQKVKNIAIQEIYAIILGLGRIEGFILFTNYFEGDTYYGGLY